MQFTTHAERLLKLMHECSVFSGEFDYVAPNRLARQPGAVGRIVEYRWQAANLHAALASYFERWPNSLITTLDIQVMRKGKWQRVGDVTRQYGGAALTSADYQRAVRAAEKAARQKEKEDRIAYLKSLPQNQGGRPASEETKLMRDVQRIHDQTQFPDREPEPDEEGDENGSYWPPGDPRNG